MAIREKLRDFNRAYLDGTTNAGARVVLNSQHVSISDRCGLGQSVLRWFRQDAPISTNLNPQRL